MMWISTPSLLVTVLVVCSLLLSVVKAQQFNYEIEKRILERLDFFLSGPVETAKIIENFRTNGGFPNQMQAEDRDLFLNLAYSLPSPLVYFGLEDGTCPGYYWSNGYYREPGNSGFNVDNAAMEKHLNSCIDGMTGAPIQCLLPPGSDFISCREGRGDESGLCEVVELCPNQPACNRDDDDCNQQLKWCRQYEIYQSPPAIDLIQRGYVPITNFCHNDQGQFSQTPGTIIDPTGDDRATTERTSCTYGDGSLVDRNLTGDYRACPGEGDCDSVFAGGYSASEYDPRYRPWYIQTRKLQKSLWLPPYPFFTLGLGLTYTQPIYATEEGTGRNIFAGVIAVDYRLEDIASFLSDSYGDTDSAILVYEESEPNYIIASSTASPASILVLSEDTSLPCPVDTGDNTGCEPIRTSLVDFGTQMESTEMDRVLVEAALLHQQEDYPEDLLSVKESDSLGSKVYISQSTTYSQEGTDLMWRVIVVEPGTRSTTDSILKGDTLFAIVCIVACLGMGICSYFAFAMYTRRTEKAIVYADWRFTIAFIMGCTLFNGSTFTLLGPNTEVTCMLRMWTFHLFFVMALSPLFVKVWRMYKLVGSVNIRRSTISNAQALLYTLPAILLQVTILTVFSFVDPPRPAEYVEQNEGALVHGVVCDTETNAPFIALTCYEFLLVFLGCVLAYLTRNMEDEFGEAKQMIFSMYNILFVGLIVVIVVKAIGLTGNEQSMLQSIGVFFGTTMSTGAFVIPRLVQVQKKRRLNTNSTTSASVRVSGLESRDNGISMASSTMIGNNLDAIQESAYEDSRSDSKESPVDYLDGNRAVDVEQSLVSEANSMPRRINFAGELSTDQTISELQD